MATESTSTRRSFLKRGALLAVPLAAAPAAVMTDEGLKARLERLENEVAIGELHRTWLRRINAGAPDAAGRLFARPQRDGLDSAVRHIAADHTGPPDTIEVAADGQSASGRYCSTVEIESAITPDCTLARMAHAQGGGFVRRTERRVLLVRYVKTSGMWAIAKVEFASA